jgi:hypothetical protein
MDIFLQKEAVNLFAALGKKIQLQFCRYGHLKRVFLTTEIIVKN